MGTGRNDISWARVARCWSAYFGAAVLCGLLLPPPSPGQFAFPLNASLLAAVCALLLALLRWWPCSLLVRVLSSWRTSLALIGLTAVTALSLGLSGWPSPRSWWMVFLLAALCSNLLLVTVRVASHRSRRRVRFVLLHGGLLLALSGGFVGAADEHILRLRLSEGEVTEVAYAASGRVMQLPEPLRLDILRVTPGPDGSPASLEASLLVGERPCRVRVNSPLALSAADDLYLIDYRVGAPAECTFEVVRQPWKYVTRAGLWMMMAGALLLLVRGLPESVGKGVTP